MSKTGRENYRRSDREAKRCKTSRRDDRSITVRSVQRDVPDLYQLSRAVIALAMDDMENETSDIPPRGHYKEGDRK